MAGQLVGARYPVLRLAVKADVRHAIGKKAGDGVTVRLDERTS